ncbi:MAG: helix-turn-helix domain-containing protein, partial [Methylovulum sp.]
MSFKVKTKERRPPSHAQNNSPYRSQAHDFHLLAKNEAHARTRVRFLGMAHLKDGLSISDVAKALRVHETTVHGWVQRFSAQGLDGIIESSRSGAKRKL